MLSDVIILLIIITPQRDSIGEGADNSKLYLKDDRLHSGEREGRPNSVVLTLGWSFLITISVSTFYFESMPW